MTLCILYSRARVFATALVIALASMTVTAFAAGAVLPTDESTLPELLRAVMDAFRGGHHVAAGALAVFAALALVKRYFTSGKIGEFLHGPYGSTIVAFGLALAGSVSAMTMDGIFSLSSVLWASGGIAIAAVGGYTAIKLLVIEPIKASKWFAASPAWVKSIFDLVLWFFDRPGAAAIVVAEQAGNAAVADAPAVGTDTLGQPEKF